MSQQLVHIPALLTTEELSIIDSLIAKANFAEGWTYITGTSLQQFVEQLK